MSQEVKALESNEVVVLSIFHDRNSRVDCGLKQRRTLLSPIRCTRCVILRPFRGIVK